MELLHGLCKAALSENGRKRVLSYGSMVNVCLIPAFLFPHFLMAARRMVFSGSWEEYPMVSNK